MYVRVFSERKTTWVMVCAIVLMSMAAAGCSQGNSAGNPSPPGVQVVEVQQKDVPIYGEWIGTLDGLVNADIKAQVSGYLLKQNYVEGSFVRKGQSLFEIDPRPFQDQAQGQLAQASGGVAQATAQLVQSEAQVTAAEANRPSGLIHLAVREKEFPRLWVGRAVGKNQIERLAGLFSNPGNILRPRQ